MSLKVRVILTPLLAAALLMIGCVSNNVVKRVSSTANGRERAREMRGVFYALPQTVVTVSLPVTRTERRAGTYWYWARVFFPNQRSIIKPADPNPARPDLPAGFSFERGEPTLSLSGEPDPDEIYLAEIKGGWFGGFFEDKQLKIELSNNGVLTAGEAETINQSLPIALKALTSLTALGRTAVFGADSGSGGGGRKTLLETMGDLSDCKPTGQQITEEELQGSCPSAQGPPLPSNPRQRRAAAPPDCQQWQFYETQLLQTEQDFFRTLNRLDRDIYRQVMHPHPDPAVKEAYQALCPRERAFLRQLAEDQQRVCYVQSSAPERALLVAMTAVERASFCALTTAEARRYYASLSAAQRQAFSDPNAQVFSDPNTNQEEFRKAKEIYDQIIDLHQRRLDLLSGNAVNHEAVQLQLKELDTAINRLAKPYFIGTETETEWVGQFDFIPRMGRMSNGRLQPPAPEKLLVAFSAEHGVCSLDGDTSNPPADFNRTDCADPVYQSAVVVKLRVAPGRRDHTNPAPAAQPADVIHDASLAERGKRGFYYRVPADGVAKVIEVKPGARDEELKRAVIAVAQFGRTVSLPASTGGRKTNYKIELSEATGALRNFELGSERLLDADMVEQAVGVPQSLVEAKQEARAARAAAEATANDELQRLTRRRQILEEKLKIKEAEAALGNP